MTAPVKQLSHTSLRQFTPNRNFFGYAPSVQEICSRFRIASTNGVFRHLKALEKKGYIRRVGKRALEILSARGRTVLPDVREVPVLGRVPAGKPLLAEENIEGFVSVDRAMASSREVFALRVQGEMIGSSFSGMAVGKSKNALSACEHAQA